MDNRDDKALTLGDYFALAIAPSLIMALVVSLVFFLVEILHVGEFQGRLQWILFFFVFGAVLIARVSMSGEISGRASIYGLFLGGATWMGLTNFVQYPPESGLAKFGIWINLGLIALVWWCAHRLTWDCTYLDDDDGAEGKGVLQAAGLEVQNNLDQPANAARPPKKTESGLAGWWKRYRRYQGQRAKQRTPGVWVIFFSLAALPLFGLGQSLIPIEETARRRYAFWLLTIYVGSGLALLLVTSFLGLRRYLRRRQTKMPTTIAGLWLTLGVGLIVLMLGVGAFLPRPAPEYPLFELVKIGSQKKDPSDKDFLGGEGVDGQGDPGDPKNDPDGDKEGKQVQDGGGKQNQGAGNQGKDKTANQKKQGKGEQKNPQKKSGKGGFEKPPTENPPWLAKLLEILKWIVFGLLAILVAFLVVRAALQFLANFTSWARNLLNFFALWWARLFGHKKNNPHKNQQPPVPATPPRPFSSYRNPFADGSAHGQSVHEVLRLTFEALEAWARERDAPRPAAETSWEFCDRLGQHFTEFHEPLRRLAMLHARANYAPQGPLPKNALEILEQMWDHLDQPVLA